MRFNKIKNEINRIETALTTVLPSGVPLEFRNQEGTSHIFKLAGTRLRIQWVAKGWPRQIQAILDELNTSPDLIIAPAMSPGARELLRHKKIGWIDELGSAEFALGKIIVSRSGRTAQPLLRSEKWSPAVIAVAEALLCKTVPTVDAVATATGLSIGACTSALKTLANAGHLVANASRGRNSARRVKDEVELLDAYAESAVSETRTRTPSVEVSGAFQDILEGIRSTGKIWDKLKISWATTGQSAAQLLAPAMTNIGSAVIYVDAKTIASLEAIAVRAGLQPIEGGRLTLKPFPTTSTQRLATIIEEIKVAPWPRVYADLKVTGVRGEDAAEHLLEVFRGK